MFGNKQRQKDTESLIAAMMQNAESNLGVKPDSASLIYLSKHPGLSAKIWEMLSEGGASWAGYLPQYHQDCLRLHHIVRDTAFKEQYPCAHAIIQYTVYLCSSDLSGKKMCNHPKDDIGAD